MSLQDYIPELKEGWSLTNYDWEGWEDKSISLKDGKFIEDDGSTGKPYEITLNDLVSENWVLVVIN